MQSETSARVDLHALFGEINRLHFDGFLEAPVLQWNSRLRSCAGRFIPGSRKYPDAYPARIEVASYLLDEVEGAALVLDVLGHEAIHYWLWIRRKPYGHTSEFLAKMREMGVSRYNPVPKKRPPKYWYQCKGCQKKFPARRRLGTLACLHCCKLFAGGKFDARFTLELVQDFQLFAIPTETL